MELDALIGTREGFSGKWYLPWTLKEKYEFTREVRLEAFTGRANQTRKGVKIEKHMVYLSVNNSVAYREWAEVESEPRYGFSILQCRYIPTIRNIFNNKDKV